MPAKKTVRKQALATQVPAKKTVVRKKKYTVTTTDLSGELSVMSKKIDGLHEEFRHVVYGNGEIGLLERVRLMNTQVGEQAVEAATAKAISDRLIAELHEVANSLKSHAGLPIHSDAAFQVLKNIEAWHAQDMTARQLKAEESKDRKRQMRALIISMLQGSLQNLIPAVLTVAATLWALLHR